MKLRELLATVDDVVQLPQHPAMDAEIKNLKTDSHACVAGDLFIGMPVPGTGIDGGDFWQSAIARSAVAAIISSQAAQKHPPTPEACVITADDIIKASAQLAATFYGYPGQKLKLVGVTGTNGKIASVLADVAVVTSTDPYTEDPLMILQDILEGIPETLKPIVMGDRATAIRTAILQAQPGDGVLLVGRGHEKYQFLGTEKIPFDDREHAREALEERMKR